jgi:cytochrome P450
MVPMIERLPTLLMSARPCSRSPVASPIPQPYRGARCGQNAGMKTSEITLDQLSADPYPILAELRRHEPVAFIPSLDMWLVTKWDDVMEVTVNEERFTAATEPSWLNTVLGPNMLGSGGQTHRRLKDATQPAFTQSATGWWVNDRLPQLCHELIDKFTEGAAVDLMTAYAEPLAVMALADALGWTTASTETIGGWTRGVCTGLANFANDPALAAIADAAKTESGASIAAQLDEVRACPVSSGLTQIAEHPNGLTDEEIIANVRLMMSGGINEPRDAICLTVWALLTQPGALEECRRDGLWRQAVDETLRWISPVATATRQVVADTELGGVMLPAGALVAAVLASANHDEDRWTAPAEFQLRRTGSHLGFAAGAHLCLGAWLGRQTVRVATQILFDRRPNLRLDREPEIVGFEFRGPTELWVA